MPKPDFTSICLLLNLAGFLFADEFGGSHSGVVFEDAIKRSFAVETRLKSNREQRMFPIFFVQKLRVKDAEAIPADWLRQQSFHIKIIQRREDKPQRPAG